ACYDVSCFARAGQQCRDSLGYWNGAARLAFGPGAHGHDGHRRWMNPRQWEDYLAWGDAGFEDAAREWDVLDEDARLTEAVSLGLSQARGFSLAALDARHGATRGEGVWARHEAAGYQYREDGPV